MTRSPVETDVAVVGFGPTGATLANLLALSGVRVAVIEREAAMYHLPRAVHFDGETMRVFQTVGIAEALSRKVRVNPGMRFVDPDGELLLDWPRPQEVGPQGWYASYRLHQPDLETLLRERLLGTENTEVLTGTEVLDVEESAEGVSLTCQDAKGARQVTARFVVGCDGARSRLRSVIGSGMDDLGFDERWLVVDVLLRRDRPDLGDHSVQFCDPVRPMTYCRSPANRRRWEITVLDHETDAEVTEEGRIWAFLSRWITPEDAELERSAVYTFRSAVAARWRQGRMMIAGDAAHLTPPFMGQGMCAGIRDAANLAWKLALVVKGQADDALLESYQQERGPNVRTFIQTAMRLGKLINTVDRRHALELAEDATGGAKMSSIAPPLGKSDLCGKGRHVGELFPQPLLADGRRMDDAVGYAPAVIARKAAFGSTGSDLPIFNASDHPRLGTILDEMAVEAVRLRPDRYISASASTEAEVAALHQI